MKTLTILLALCAVAYVSCQKNQANQNKGNPPAGASGARNQPSAGRSASNNPSDASKSTDTKGSSNASKSDGNKNRKTKAGSGTRSPRRTTVSPPPAKVHDNVQAYAL